jgi:mitochondrial protein import protein ZIM17
MLFLKRLLEQASLSCIKPRHRLSSFLNRKSLFSTVKEESEYESIKRALEADKQRKSLADQEGQIQSEKRMLIGFTCKKCQNRTHRTMSHHAYHHGIVLIECSGCQSRHLIADNLGWFKDTPNAARKIEEMTMEVGEIRRSLKLNEKESEGLIELLKD